MFIYVLLRFLFFLLFFYFLIWRWKYWLVNSFADVFFWLSNKTFWKRHALGCFKIILKTNTNHIFIKRRDTVTHIAQWETKNNILNIFQVSKKNAYHKDRNNRNFWQNLNYISKFKMLFWTEEPNTRINKFNYYCYWW